MLGVVDLCELTEASEALRREAETVLPPALAILLECAFEIEANPKAAEFLRRLIARYNACAERGLPLHTPKTGSGAAEVYTRRLSGDNHLVGIVSAETVERELVFMSDAAPESRELDAMVAELLLLCEVAPLCPMVVGVGVADTQDEALECARAAMFRSADKQHEVRAIADTEKRITARLNQNGPGAGGFGGRRTAICSAIEVRGTGWVAVSPGDYFTSYAKGSGAA